MNRVSKSFIRFFNMVEVTLAIAVVGIGVAGIMSLFPVAVSSTRDSIADNYSADIADQIIAYVSALAAQEKWSSGSSTFKTKIPFGDPDSTGPAPGTTCSTQVLPNNENIYAGSAGIFKVLMKSSTVTDFSAYVKVWRAQLPAVYIAGVTAQAGWDLNNTYGAGIHIEISYPAEAPYVQRKKMHYYFEVSNPDPTP